ncbi:MAG TPA: hypothetical protein PLE78_09640 [Flavobacteriales bacterium]|jgi:hypothetical protein|nr:hypothetical protein [Flavobacteriales bacterium]HQV75741.1 hypothetical protein [Flavobacteriales bacterium]
MNDRPVFDQPFELWREDGVLHLVLGMGAQVRISDMKEFIRLVAALDRSGNSPVLIEHARGANVAEDARMLLRRVCGAQGHPVGLLAIDPEGRAQAEIFKILERPAFPFRVFARRDEAWRWVRERRQLAALVMRP